jgi:hypothetical protein
MSTLPAERVVAEKILAHALKLQRIFPQAGLCTPRSLFRQIQVLEDEAQRVATTLCNQPMPTGWGSRRTRELLSAMDTILGFKSQGIAVELDMDPRGYAFKIPPKIAKDLDIEKDFGGYGIICPKF